MSVNTMHNQALFDKLRRFSAEDPNGCWIWQRSFIADGYGQACIPGHPDSVGAHRAMWYAVNGELFTKAQDVQICHSCDVPACVNPAHLFKGSKKDNMLDMAKKGRSYWGRKTHCINGHEFTVENTLRNGKQRLCKACGKENDARARQRAKQRLQESGGRTPLTAEVRIQVRAMLLDGMSVSEISAVLRLHYNQVKRIASKIPEQLAQPALLSDRIQPLRRPTLRLKQR